MAKPTPVEGLHRDTPRDEGLRRLILGRLADLLRYRQPLAGPGLAADRVEVVHDARVATRRLRAALALYKFSPAQKRRQVRDEVKELGRALGAVRDMDLLEGWLTERLEQAGPKEQLGISALLRHVAAQHAEREDVLWQRASGFFGEGVARVEACAAELHAGSGRLGGRAVRRRLRRRIEAAAACVGPAVGGKPDFVHELRIRAKKLRYHAELLEGVVDEAGVLLKALGPLQEALGRLHDLDARVHWLVEQVAQAAREELTGVGWLLQVSYLERVRCFSEVVPELHRWDDEEIFAHVL